MWRVGLLLAALVGPFGAIQAGRSMQDLTFLTRDGCVNTPDMRLNLDDALIKLGWRRNYQEIDLGTLPKDDPRTGYPTPTVLWKRHDIFSMAVPKPPYPTPT
jgi:hypothetical protein